MSASMLEAAAGSCKQRLAPAIFAQATLFSHVQLPVQYQPEAMSRYLEQDNAMGQLEEQVSETHAGHPASNTDAEKLAQHGQTKVYLGFVVLSTCSNPRCAMGREQFVAEPCVARILAQHIYGQCAHQAAAMSVANLAG